MIQTQKARVTKGAAKSAAAKLIRLQPATIKRLHKILEAVNKKDYGKRVRPDAVIVASLELLGDKEIESLRCASMSNADRLELAYRSHVARDGQISKDEFLGLLLASRVEQSHGIGVEVSD